MAVHASQGHLVRSWRKHAGLSLTDVAKHLHTVKPAVSNYELAKREITFETMKALDDLYGAEGGLFDMAQSLGTPFALTPREHWVFHPETARPVVEAHFADASAPSSWVLVRPGPGQDRVNARVAYGSTTFIVSVPCDAGGVFVQLPSAVEPASIAVRLHTAGWVDQGRGPAPAHLGRPVLDLAAGSQARRRDASPEERAVRDGAAPLTVPTAYEAGSPPVTGADRRRIRAGRCYVLKDVAAWVTALMPDEPVTVDAIRRLEQGQSSRCRFLRSRLDVVYEAGGHTTDEIVDVHGTRERFELRFPAFWVGPVWFEFLSETRCRADVRIRQGTRAQVVRVVPGACVVDERRRRAADPYVVACPVGWRVRAGMGARPMLLMPDGADPPAEPRR